MGRGLQFKVGVPALRKKEGGARSKRNKMSLRGGPSYNYSYDELDPTELQYLQEGALQESHQAGSFLAKSSFQAHQSFSQSYWQRYVTPAAPSQGR